MPSDTNANKYAATTWGGELTRDLECPSGQVCLVRRVGPEGLIQAGILSSLDGLTGIVQNELIPAAEGKPRVDAKKILENPEQLAEMIHMVDRVVTFVVVEPKVEMTPNDQTRRVSGTIYADMVDLEDRMFIMNFAMGGTAKIADFREESARAVDPVVKGKKPKRSAQ